MTIEWEPDELGGEAEEVVVGVPSFAAGGRVDRTGMVLVHEGEEIHPAPGSEAVLSPLAPGSASSGPVVNYNFPVEVEVIGELAESQARSVADLVYDELDMAFKTRR